LLNQAEYYVKNKAKNVPEIDASIEAIAEYITKEDYYDSKATRLEEWECYAGDLFELVISVFTICLQGPQTYQSLVGMLAGKIPMKKKWHRIQTMAEVIAVIASTGLIRVTKMGAGESIIVDTEYTLEGIPEPTKHEIVFKAPELISNNSTNEDGSMFLGSRFNHHDGEICLDHLNRMNQVKLKLNIPFLMVAEETPKTIEEFTKALTEKHGHDAMIFGTATYPDYLKQWDIFAKDSRGKYLEIGKKSFYQKHKYDARGRTYAIGYYVNYQGASFKKASIQLAKKETVHR